MDSIKYEGSQHQRRDVYSGGSRGGARGGCPPLFFDQTEARRAEKVLFLRPGPPALSQGLDDRATPLSEGLDRPLV